MIGVFLLKRIIAVIRRVTAISDLLKPATWEKIAIAHGLVGLSFLLVYGFLDRRVQETDIPPVAIAQLLPSQVRIAQPPALWSPNPEIVDIIAVEPSRIDQGFTLPSIGAPERHVVLQPGSTGGQSLLETVMKLLALFQGITMMINGSVASILGLIAYHRNKVDMAVKHLELELKRLQILQIQDALDKQARERLKEAEEAARSSIILIS